MRTFTYSFPDEAEVFIDVHDESGTLQYTAKFPTHLAVKSHWEKDFDYYSDINNAPRLTTEEKVDLKAIIDKLPD